MTTDTDARGAVALLPCIGCQYDRPAMKQWFPHPEHGWMRECPGCKRCTGQRLFPADADRAWNEMNQRRAADPRAAAAWATSVECTHCHGTATPRVIGNGDALIVAIDCDACGRWIYPAKDPRAAAVEGEVVALVHRACAILRTIVTDDEANVAALAALAAARVTTLEDRAKDADNDRKGAEAERDWAQSREADQLALTVRAQKGEAEWHEQAARDSKTATEMRKRAQKAESGVERIGRVVSDNWKYYVIACQDRDAALIRAKKAEARVVELEAELGAMRNPPVGAVAALSEALKTIKEERDACRDLVHTMWIHSGYPDCGYGQMTTPQKALYLHIINRPGQPKKAERPDARGEGQWISCSERLPEEGQWVLTSRLGSRDCVPFRVGRLYVERRDGVEFTDATQDRYWFAEWWMAPNDPRPAPDQGPAGDGAIGAAGRGER